MLNYRDNNSCDKIIKDIQKSIDVNIEFAEQNID